MVAFLGRFSRNFEEGVAIQTDLTTRDIAIVAIREQIDTREGSVAANFFRWAMLAQGAYQVESASERIRMGLERARDADPEPGAGGTVPVHGRGRGQPAGDCPGAELFAVHCEEGPGGGL